MPKNPLFAILKSTFASLSVNSATKDLKRFFVAASPLLRMTADGKVGFSVITI
jgi:hypothetical protein